MTFPLRLHPHALAASLLLALVCKTHCQPVARGEEVGILPGMAMEAPPERLVLERSALPARGGAFVDHAPLALFSLGSLAVGGVFFSIHSSWNSEKGSFTSGSRSEMTTAVGAAGITALLAGATYLYYANRPDSRSEPWMAEISGSLTPSGITASVSLPVNNLLP